MGEEREDEEVWGAGRVWRRLGDGNYHTYIVLYPVMIRMAWTFSLVCVIA